MDVTINACQTTWGWVGLAVSANGLLGTTLPVVCRDDALAPLFRRWASTREGTNAHLAGLQAKLQRYFLGEDVDFREERLLGERSGAFTQRVWDIVREIPRGEVRSYGWVAQRAGSLRGARAVGRAMATNPFPLIVPCHRVVGQDGQLTGFGGGVAMKRRLLELEGAHLALQASLTTLP